MQNTIIISSIILAIVILFVFGLPAKSFKLLGKGILKFGLGILFLFIINVSGGVIGLHIPINLFTASISAFLGVFGVIALIVLHLFIIPA